MTVRFASSSLSKVAQWVEDNAGILVLFDLAALEELGVSPGEFVSDGLADEPLSLLLNRLKSLELSWDMKDNVVRITSVEAATEHEITVPYTVGDLLDQGFEADVLNRLLPI